MMRHVYHSIIAILFACLAVWVWRQPIVQAQSLTNCGNTESTCKAQANANQASCKSTCGKTYPLNSAAYTSCITNCNNQAGTNLNDCTNQYNSCISANNSACAQTYCANDCPPPNSLNYPTWNDGEAECVCTCACPGSPPACPGPHCDGGGWICDSPIVIDSKGEGFHLTSVADGVWFDWSGDGKLIHIAWTNPSYSNGWLVLDRNGNGTIDDASELFGNETPQPASASPNGYLALAVFDQSENGGNDDGLIDDKDAVYDKLRVWIDSNHDGISQTDELHTLRELGIGRIDLQYTEVKKTDQYGNVFRYRARVWDDEGNRGNRFTYDVFLQ